ncbi:N-acetylmuramate alpha-1-phosphate uridylyltransferase MurU [Nitrosomonas sp.]
MILAAGKGERMRPLTDTCPKPLLRAGGKMLIEYHLEKLAHAGFTNVVINHAYLGNMIETALQDGKHYGIHIHYSPESLVLETAGGIANALPLLTNSDKNQPFAVINADIFCDMDFSILQPLMQQMQSNLGKTLAHLILVDNPPHHPEGDFFLHGDTGELVESARPNCQKLTFSGIGIYHPALFADVPPNQAVKLAPLLRQAISAEKATGSHSPGVWLDIGTPERLQQLDIRLNRSGRHL